MIKTALKVADLGLAQEILRLQRVHPNTKSVLRRIIRTVTEGDPTFPEVASTSPQVQYELWATRANAQAARGKMPLGVIEEEVAIQAGGLGLPAEYTAPMTAERLSRLQAEFWSIAGEASLADILQLRLYADDPLASLHVMPVDVNGKALIAMRNLTPNAENTIDNPQLHLLPQPQALENAFSQAAKVLSERRINSVR